MKTCHFISIIIPTYNKTVLLPLALDIILAQKYSLGRFEGFPTSIVEFGSGHYLKIIQNNICNMFIQHAEKFFKHWLTESCMSVHALHMVRLWDLLSPKEVDYIDIHATNREELREKIKNLYALERLEACRLCLPNEEREIIPVAVQQESHEKLLRKVQ